MIIILYEREHSELMTLLHPASTNKFSMNRNPAGLIPRTHHTYLHCLDHCQHIQDDPQPFFKYSLFKSWSFKEIAEQLGGLPRIKLHCAVLSRQGLEAALPKYEAKRGHVKIDESFVNKILRGVLDPVEGVDIISAKMFESVA
jgi:hypothetical protein